ncbi:MAG: GNAT family N-acetyltransferase [Caulobacterales bacterium]
MDETEELIRLSVRALVAQMNAAPGFELHMTRNCVLGLTDEPLADFNMLILGLDPDAEGFLTRSVARAKARGLPLLAMMSPQVAQTLAPAAKRLGLTAAGASPLMLLRAGTPVRPSRPTKITRALGPELVGVAGDLVAAAFDVPREAVARCIDVGLTETAGVETYIAWGDEGPMSAVSVTPTGNTAGISLMATLPEHQCKGMGRALLTQVIDDYRRRGVERFHLGATEAGRPLYASLGFETIAELSAWVLVPSTQAHG